MQTTRREIRAAETQWRNTRNTHAEIRARRVRQPLTIGRMLRNAFGWML